jgi:Uma2 family endonuclease
LIASWFLGIDNSIKSRELLLAKVQRIKIELIKFEELILKRCGMSKITELSQLDLNGIYSYADYMQWHFEQYVELIKGKIMPMSAPNTRHQQISWRLAKAISNFAFPKSCQAFSAPFDVRLFDRKKSKKADKDIFTVVQPDLCVICDSNKIDERGCLGAPDWVIEILSRGNSKKELQQKFELYEESGVKEYWIVYPDQETIHQFVLNEEGKYQLLKMYVSDQAAIPTIFPELSIALNDIFVNPNDL